MGLEAELNPEKLFQVKMLIKWFVVYSDFNHIKEKQTNKKKPREFCLLSKYRCIFQNANSSLGEKSAGDFFPFSAFPYFL